MAIIWRSSSAFVAIHGVLVDGWIGGEHADERVLLPRESSKWHRFRGERKSYSVYPTADCHNFRRGEEWREPQ